MLPPAIDQRCHSPARQIVEPSTDQRKPLRSEILDVRRKVELSIKPWLDRVLIGRGYVQQVSSDHRADMIGQDVLRDQVPLARLSLGPAEIPRDRYGEKNGSCDRNPAPGRVPDRRWSFIRSGPPQRFADRLLQVRRCR